ncbi:hypothetical protein EG328_005831 [Venturia inaequalis]|uniref:Uncharacterized protein n=1 Tax=Venturia inaequalis TaxID=5025 RepID=A0A8H3V144_VENIN|nr:hypothetical protein EG328_005831 [Venturia inaequalis]KAE9979146.1 hypothetical protein EG327_007143 [Venturia inaequalis]
MARRRPMRKPHLESTRPAKKQDASNTRTAIKTKTETETRTTTNQVKRELKESLVGKLDGSKLWSQIVAESLVRKEVPLPSSNWDKWTASEAEYGWGESGEVDGTSWGAVDLDPAPWGGPSCSAPQPVQQIPEEIRKALEDTRETVPTFLFRASRPSSGSGIELTEDGKVKMVPRAYLNGGSGSIHENIYEIPDLACMMSGHLNSGDVNTEFSSWAASLLFSHGFIDSDDPEARISIIVGVDEESMYEEYLLHGVLEAGPGSGYKSVLYSELKAKGIGPAIWQAEERSEQKPALMATEVKHAKHIAASYGPKFITPFTAALLGNIIDPYDHGPTVTKEDIEILQAVLYEDTQTTVENFLGVRTIMEDVVYVDGNPDTAVSILLLRELTKHTHGKDAKRLDHQKVTRKLHEIRKRQFWAGRTFGRGVPGVRPVSALEDSHW